MTNENQNPADDIIIEVEDAVVTPVEAEQNNVGGDTPKNEVDGPAVKGGAETKTNVGAVVAKLGEGKKMFASNLVELAKTSSVAQEKVRELMANDVEASKYVKEKFPESYDLIIAGKDIAASVPDSNIDLVKIEEEARIKAKLELYKEQLEESNLSAMKNKAVELGFNSEEYAKFEANAKVLGYDRLEDAALLVNQEKARAKAAESYVPATNGQAPAPVQGNVVKVSRNLADYAAKNGVNINDLAQAKKTFESRSSGNTLYLEGI